MRLHLKEYPNKILKEVCRPIKRIELKHKSWARAMHYFMKEFGGIGLAAPQVGNPVRLIVVNTTQSVDNGVKLTLINPEIIEESAKTVVGQEGCLSFPLKFIDVERSVKIKVKYTNLEGEEVVDELEGLNARVVQHEIDHLNGILFIDKEVDK